MMAKSALLGCVLIFCVGGKTYAAGQSSLIPESDMTGLSAVLASTAYVKTLNNNLAAKLNPWATTIVNSLEEVKTTANAANDLAKDTQQGVRQTQEQLGELTESVENLNNVIYSSVSCEKNVCTGTRGLEQTVNDLLDALEQAGIITYTATAINPVRKS